MKGDVDMYNYPYYGNSGFGDGWWIWIVIIIIFFVLFFNNNNSGNKGCCR